ncbi:hypothetical protein O3G_MSEX002205 [Manduca sexta]|nr:hypothetical protein O3G_MSEX002205 [Manduca sexta]
MAAPNPKPAPEPAPQFLTYSSGLDYVYPSGVVRSVVSPYGAGPVPLAYSAVAPGAAVFVR